MVGLEVSVMAYSGDGVEACVFGIISQSVLPETLRIFVSGVAGLSASTIAMLDYIGTRVRVCIVPGLSTEVPGDFRIRQIKACESEWILMLDEDVCLMPDAIKGMWNHRPAVPSMVFVGGEILEGEVYGRKVPGDHTKVWHATGIFETAHLLEYCDKLEGRPLFEDWVWNTKENPEVVKEVAYHIRPLRTWPGMWAELHRMGEHDGFERVLMER